MRKSKGYSIIELLIVVATIIILFSIVLSIKSGFRGNASPTYVAPAVQRLVCIKDGETVRDEPSLPGEVWYFETGVYVTKDSRGNAVVFSPIGDCVIK